MWNPISIPVPSPKRTNAADDAVAGFQKVGKTQTFRESRGWGDGVGSSCWWMEPACISFGEIWSRIAEEVCGVSEGSTVGQRGWGWGGERGREKGLSLIKLPPPATSPLCLLSSLYPSCHPSLISSPSCSPCFCSKSSRLLWASPSWPLVAVYRPPDITSPDVNAITIRHHALHWGEWISAEAKHDLSFLNSLILGLFCPLPPAS